MYTPLMVSGRSHFGSNFWDAYSSKLNRDVHFYSDLEYDYWVLVETNPDIVTFCEQPLKINGKFAGKEVSSIFDMWIKRKNGMETFIEIKYSKDLQPSSARFEDVFKQTTIQKEWCKEKGIQYKIITEQDVRKNKILLENLRIMLPYLRYQNEYIETDFFQVMKTVNEGARTLDEICYQLPQKSRYKLRQLLYFLIYKQKICSNINEKPLGGETEVWINGKKEND